MTRRQRILEMTDGGMTQRAIAAELGITYQSVQYHLRAAGREPDVRKGQRPGREHASWKGGRTIDRQGYVLVRAYGRSKPYIGEHVLAAEERIGRALRSDEVVHHINGDKTDNRSENLVVMTRSEHRTLHAQLEGLAWELVRSGAIEWAGDRYRFS